MGILDAFSGSPGRQAGIYDANQAYSGVANINASIGAWEPQQLQALLGGLQGASGALQGGQAGSLASLLGGYNAATGAVTQGYGGAMGAVGQGYGGAMGTVQGGLQSSLASLLGGLGAGQGQIAQGANQATGDIAGSLGAALSSLGQGYGAAENVVAGSNAPLQPYIGAGTGAIGTLANALGLGGQAGNQQAMSQFQAGPGYQWQTQQALDAVTRNAAAQGMTGSGNALTALQATGNQLANQSWNQWLSNLSGIGNTGLNAAQAQIGNNATLGGLMAGQGLQGANMMNQAGTQMAGIAQGTGNLMGQQTIAAGQQAGQMQTNAASQLANAQIQQGGALSNLLTGQGNQLGTLASNLGANQSNVYSNVASQLANAQTGYGQNVSNVFGTDQAAQIQALTNATQQQIQGGNTALMAGQQASASELNALLGGLGSLGGLLRPSGSAGTGPSVIGSIGSSLGGLLSGGLGFLGSL
jgi:hypothetical protein